MMPAYLATEKFENTALENRLGVDFHFYIYKHSEVYLQASPVCIAADTAEILE